jgi:hypothetical protein
MSVNCDHEGMAAKATPRPPVCGRERIMIRGEGRIVAAAVAVFVALGGIAAAINGLLFDREHVTWYGVLAVLIAATTFVVMLTPFPGDEP